MSRSRGLSLRGWMAADEAKGRKHTRTVYFPTERGMAVVTRRCEQFPCGPVFRNKIGNKWTANAVKCRFEDIEVAFEAREMERQEIELDVSEGSIEAMMKTLSPTKR